jgi:predicted lipid-binding transport protein (Tim44 family)
MQRSVVLTALGAMFLATLLWSVDAWARAGGGGSSGSRGSRSFSAPARPDTSPSSPGRQATPPSGFQQSPAQRSGWMGGLMGGIGGFLLGGLLGSMLFGGMGGMGHGLFGGIGFMEILLLAGVLYFVYAYLKRRRQSAPASSYGYTTPRESDTGYWQSGSSSAPSATAYTPDATSDLERGLEHIRQMDVGFDPRRFSDTASDLFFRVQGAWMGRDMTPVRDLLAPEMYETMQKDCDRMRAEGRIDRMENIAVRSVDVTEAWQESGRDYITVHFLASMLDYTIDERTTDVIKGSRSEPVKFEEYWTFVRPVGPNPWRLSAIQQA